MSKNNLRVNTPRKFDLLKKALLLIFLIVVIYFVLSVIVRHKQDTANNNANAAFNTAIESLPDLSGPTIWSTDKTISDSPGGLEPVEGHDKRVITKFVVAETVGLGQAGNLGTSFTNKGWQDQASGVTLATPTSSVAQSKLLFFPSSDPHITVTANIFVFSSIADAKDKNPFGAMTSTEEQFESKLTEHFSSSQLPVYGYIFIANYTYD